MIVPTIADMNQLIVDNLHKIRKLGPATVVGLPRSGLIPASIISTYLGWPLSTVEEFMNGLTYYGRKTDVVLHGRILLVDDMVHSGKQMNNALKHLMEKYPNLIVRFLSIYDAYPNEPKHKRVLSPDLSLMQLERKDDTSYSFPWFMWKSKQSVHYATDMDGVLCRDCGRKENDDGDNYARFIVSAEQKFKPLCPIGPIVTARLEKWRSLTEDWLADNGVEYERLIMGPWDSKAERGAHGVAQWKARVYAELPQKLYIESSVREAEIIATLSKKAVFCIDNQRFYHEGWFPPTV